MRCVRRRLWIGSTYGLWVVCRNSCLYFLECVCGACDGEIGDMCDVDLIILDSWPLARQYSLDL